MARPYFAQGRLSVYRLQYQRPAINAPARNKVWPRKTSEELHCMREIGNPHDPTAVAIQTEIGSEIVTVGHIPKRISALTSRRLHMEQVLKSNMAFSFLIQAVQLSA